MLALYKMKEKQLRSQSEERIVFYKALSEKSQKLEEHLTLSKSAELYQNIEIKETAQKHLEMFSKENQQLQQKIQAALTKPAISELMLDPVFSICEEMQKQLTKFKEYFQGFQPGRDKRLLDNIIKEIETLVNNEPSILEYSALSPAQIDALNKALQILLTSVKALFPSYHPSCFISYAWGETEVETLARGSLATHLQDAGVDIQLDIRHNAKLGSSIPDFIAKINHCQYTLLIGSPAYGQKIQATNNVVRQEYEIICGKYKQAPEQVLKVLVAGTAQESFPPSLGGETRVYASMIDQKAYFQVFPMLLEKLFEIPLEQSAENKENFDKQVKEYQEKISSVLPEKGKQKETAQFPGKDENPFPQ